MARISLQAARPFAFVAVAALSAFVFAPAASAQPQGEAPPTAVTVQTLQPQSLVLTSTLPGRVRASAEAEVRPQVSGVIEERLFTEGTHVEAGEVLYRIDATTYEAAVAQAQAQLNQAEAQLRAATLVYDRAATLRDRNVGSQQSLDDATSARDSARAQVEIAQAQLKVTQIELDRTEIRARLSGQIGLSDIGQGALVTAGQTTPLTTIRRLDPVHVDVTQSAAEVLARRRGEAETGDLATAAVMLTLADGSTFEHTGSLQAAEPHVDEQTGVVVLRIAFPNPDGLLLPGMYVQVEMPTRRVENVYLAPQESVTRDRRGKPQALVVNADNVVEQRDLIVVQDRGSDWIVSDGLDPGDRIVVAGMQKIAPGATVTPQERQVEAAVVEGDDTVRVATTQGDAASETE